MISAAVSSAAALEDKAMTERPYTDAAVSDEEQQLLAYLTTDELEDWMTEAYVRTRDGTADLLYDSWAHWMDVAKARRDKIAQEMVVFDPSVREND
jgi:hypothetical protein